MPPEAMDDGDGGSGLRIEVDSQTSAAWQRGQPRWVLLLLMFASLALAVLLPFRCQRSPNGG
jgi:hypothetical protein